MLEAMCFRSITDLSWLQISTDRTKKIFATCIPVVFFSWLHEWGTKLNMIW